MAMIDFAMIGLIVLSTVIGLFRGFFKEALSVATWVIALWAAWKFGPQLADSMTVWLSTSVLRLWAARAILFIAVLLVGGLLNWLLGLLLHKTGLSGADRVLGMVFGLGRGVILMGLIIVILELMGSDETSWWQESKLIPYAAPVVDTIRYVVEDGQEFLSELESSSSPTEAL